MKQLLLIACALMACSKCPKKKAFFTEWQTIPGREEYLNEQIVLRPVYHAKVPHDWKRLNGEAKQDTTLPNASYLVENEVKVNVHSFPSEDIRKRIPPSAQVERWKSQLPSETRYVCEPISSGGFFGFFFEAKGDQKMTLGWAMQLDLELFQTLTLLANTPMEKEHYKQMCADYTIKVHGPEKLVEKHKQDIIAFAESFELIQEISGPDRM